MKVLVLPQLHVAELVLHVVVLVDVEVVDHLARWATPLRGTYANSGALMNTIDTKAQNLMNNGESGVLGN